MKRPRHDVDACLAAGVGRSTVHKRKSVPRLHSLQQKTAQRVWIRIILCVLGAKKNWREAVGLCTSKMQRLPVFHFHHSHENSIVRAMIHTIRQYRPRISGLEPIDHFVKPGRYLRFRFGRCGRLEVPLFYGSACAKAMTGLVP